MKKYLVFLLVVYSCSLCRAEVNNDSIACLKFLSDTHISGYNIQKYNAYEITKRDTVDNIVRYYFKYKEKELYVEQSDKISIDTISKESLLSSDDLKESFSLKGMVLHASCPIAITGISVIVDGNATYITDAGSEEIELQEGTEVFEVALSDASHTIPNYVFKLSDIKADEGKNGKSFTGFDINYIVIIGIVLIIILGIVLFFLLNRQMSDIKKLLRKDEVVAENEALKTELKELKDKVELQDKQLKEFEEVKKQAESAQNWENRYSELDEAKKKVDSELREASKKLKEMPALQNKLSLALQWKSKYDEMKGEKENKEAEIRKIQGQLDDERSTSSNWKKKYEDSLTIKDAVKVAGIEKFVIDARQLLDSLVKGRQSINDFVWSLSVEDRNKLDYYIAKFLTKVPIKEIERWAGIIEGLNINGYIKDSGYVKYIKGQNEEEREKSLEKYFFEDLARPYVSPVVVLLEVLRTANRIGLSKCYKDASEIIENIINSCYQLKVSVDYYKLFEPLKDSQFKNIKTIKIPESLDNILPSGTEKVLYVENYAVNSPFSNSTEESKLVYPM